MKIYLLLLEYYQTILRYCCSVTKSYPTLCDPMNCSTPGFPVLHYFPELAQTHVHWVSDVIQLSHPLLSPSSPALNLSWPASVSSNESALHIRWSKYWSFSFSISPSNEHSGLISFRMDWFDILAVWGTLQNLLQHHRSKASRHSAFFMVQLSHPYMTTGKIIALTRWSFVGKVLSLLLIAFLPRSKHLLIWWLQSLFAVILESKKIKSVTVSIVSPSTCHEVMRLDAWYKFFKCWVSSQLFHSPLSPSLRSSLVLYFLPLEQCHPHVWGYWYLIKIVLICRSAWREFQDQYSPFCLQNVRMDHLGNFPQWCPTVSNIEIPL